MHRRVRAAGGKHARSSILYAAACARARARAWARDGREYSLVQGDLRRRVISAPHAVAPILPPVTRTVGRCCNSGRARRGARALAAGLRRALCRDIMRCVGNAACASERRPGPSAGPVPACTASALLCKARRIAEALRDRARVYSHPVLPLARSHGSRHQRHGTGPLRADRPVPTGGGARPSRTMRAFVRSDRVHDCVRAWPCQCLLLL